MTMQKTVFYELNPRFFKDSNGDGVGDLGGIIANFDYFNHLGVESIILQGIIDQELAIKKSSFVKIDPTIGTNNDLEVLTTLAKSYKQRIIIEFDLGLLYKKYYWFRDSNGASQQTKPRKASKTVSNSETNKAPFDISFKNNPTPEVVSKWKNELAIKHFLKALQFWKQLGVNGFIFENFEYLADEASTNVINEQTLFEIRKVYYLTKEIDQNFILIGRTQHVDFDRSGEYAHPNSKLFDYFMSLKVPFLGISPIYGLDRAGQFSSKVYSMFIREKYAHKDTNVIAFNTKGIGKALSRWGDSEQYLEESAKALAILLMMNNASPLLYVGDEIGLPNAYLPNDTIFQTAAFEEQKALAFSKRISETDFHNAHKVNSPLNAKTPMIWNKTKNGGFSTATETISPIARFSKLLNVKHQYNDSRSVLNFYRHLIRLVRFSSFSSLLQSGQVRVPRFASGVIRYTITHLDQKIDVLINISDVNKVNLYRKQTGMIIFSSYNRDYAKIPSLLEPYEALVIASTEPKYFKTNDQIAIERLQKSKIEKQVRQRAKLKATRKLQQQQKLKKLRQAKMISEQIKIAQEEERAYLFKKHRAKQEKSQKKKRIEEIMKDSKKDVKEKTFDPFATNDLDLNDLKDSTKIDHQWERPHLKETTKLKEEELAKTTLLDENVDFKKLFDSKKNSKK